MSHSQTDPQAVQVETKHQTYQLEAFSTRRSGQVVDAVGALFEAYGGVLEDAADYRQQYGNEHKVTFTHDMCSERIAVLQSRVAVNEDEAIGAQLDQAIKRWEQMLENIGDSGSISIPAEPAEEQVWAAILRPAIRKYGDEIARLVGLLVMTNEQFAETRKAARGSDAGLPALAEALLERGDAVLDKVAIDETIQLLLAGATLIRADIDASRELAGKLQEVARQMFQNGAAEDESSTSQQVGSTTESEQNSESSTASPGDTGGPKTPSSTNSPSVELTTSPT